MSNSLTDLDHDGHADHPDHSHGLVDPSIVRSKAGVRAVTLSLAVLLAASVAQFFVVLLSGSVALLTDVIHNGGDALTAIPLGIAFPFAVVEASGGPGTVSSPSSSPAHSSRSSR